MGFKREITMRTRSRFPRGIEAKIHGGTVQPSRRIFRELLLAPMLMEPAEGIRGQRTLERRH